MNYSDKINIRYGTKFDKQYCHANSRTVDDDAAISFICSLKHNQNQNKEIIKKKRSTSQKSN